LFFQKSQEKVDQDANPVSILIAAGHGYQFNNIDFIHKTTIFAETLEGIIIQNLADVV